MWIAVLVLMSPLYVGLIVGGRTAMKRGRDTPWLYAAGIGAFWAGLAMLIVLLLSYPILGIELTTVTVIE